MSNRIAICFSGQIRTGVIASQSILRYVGDLLPDVDFFIHTWDTETISKWGLQGRDKNLADKPFPVNPEKFIKMEEIYHPIKMQIDSFGEYRQKKHDLLSYAGYSEHPLFHSAYESNMLKKQYEDANNFKYKLVIKMRPDMVMNSRLRLEDEVHYVCDHRKTDVFYVNDQWNKCPESIEDICWMSSSDTMDIACDYIREREINNSYRDIDWQTHHRIYLEKHGILSRPFKYNELYIYRDYHVEAGISPLDTISIKSFTN